MCVASLGPQGSLSADPWFFSHKYKLNPKINYRQWQKSRTAYCEPLFPTLVFKSVPYIMVLG